MLTKEQRADKPGDTIKAMWVIVGVQVQEALGEDMNYPLSVKVISDDAIPWRGHTALEVAAAEGSQLFGVNGIGEFEREYNWPDSDTDPPWATPFAVDEDQLVAEIVKAVRADTLGIE